LKWLKIDQNNLRAGTAKAVARFVSFAQITCCFYAGLAWFVAQVLVPSHRVTNLYDSYTCLAKNSHGSSNDTVRLIEACKLSIV